MARSKLPCGVESRCNSLGDQIQPISAITADISTQKPRPEPNVRRAASTLRAPKCWPTRTVVAEPKPNTNANIRNITPLALVVAASAFSPSSRPTQIALIDPLSVWIILPISIGIEKAISVLKIGPWVRSPCTGGCSGTGSLVAETSMLGSSITYPSCRQTGGCASGRRNSVHFLNKYRPAILPGRAAWWNRGLRA